MSESMTVRRPPELVRVALRLSGHDARYPRDPWPNSSKKFLLSRPCMVSRLSDPSGTCGGLELA